MAGRDFEGARRRDLRDKRRPDWRSLPVTPEQKRYIGVLLRQAPADERPVVVVTRGDASDLIARCREAQRRPDAS